jgi:hypothetical protein
MENYSIESLPEPDPKERRITRLLLYVWLILGLMVVSILCYVGISAFRPPPPEPLYVGDVDEYPPDSVNKEFINADFFDTTANKAQDTLPLQIVRDANGSWKVFYARSTNPTEAILTPRQCVVEWDESISQFLELCGGSRWSRDGKYVAGPAPRDLDSFPARVEDGKLYIEKMLIPGAPRP